MKARKSSSASISSFSFYALLILSILTFLLMVSCNENPAAAEPQIEGYFDTALLNYENYIYSSIPAFGLDNNPINAQQNRALIYWYNETPPAVSVNQILGYDVKVNSDQFWTTVLDAVYNPSRKGVYNNGTLSPELRANWGGFFRILPDSTIKKFKKKNLVMKIWFKIVDAPEQAQLNIDLGRISEDIIPNGRLDTEDRNQNDLLDQGEDTGIDGIFDVEEPNYNNGNDSDNDDFYLAAGKYEKINGLENNGLSGERKAPDTEDINRNFTLDKNNDYFSYIIPLQLDKILATKITEVGNNGWVLIKIPVDLPDLKVGSPDNSKIETIRLWITNANQPVHIQMAQIKFDEI